MVKAVKTPDAQVATANRLRDGAVVYLTADNTWSTDFADSAVARDAASAERLMAVANQAAADQIVVGPYLIEVALKADRIEPLGTRERIRSRGPSVSERPAA
jgi:Protein of unknown function (DUF2849)